MSDWWLIGSLVIILLVVSAILVYPLRRYTIFSSLLLPMVWICSFAGYYYWGGFSQWQHYLEQQNKVALAQQTLKSIKDPQELIEKLRAKLDDSPKSATGWYLLGRLYLSQNEMHQASQAFAKAHQYKPDDERFAVNYGQSLWEENQQQFTVEIRNLFQSLLAKNPNQPDALAMLAMDSFTNHKPDQAILYWKRLLKVLPPQSEEALAIRQAIAKAQGAAP